MNQITNVFLLDANVFMQAHKQYYAFDICPGFWECVIGHQGLGNLMSIDKVKEEIDDGKDELLNWVNNDAPPNLFAPTDEQAVQDKYTEIISWVTENPQFKPEAKTKFAARADGWLIAYAEVHKMIVVTEESFNPNVQSRVPIPNVCDQFGVLYMNTFKMLRELTAQFQWTQL